MILLAIAIWALLSLLTALVLAAAAAAGDAAAETAGAGWLAQPASAEGSAERGVAISP